MSSSDFDIIVSTLSRFVESDYIPNAFIIHVCYKNGASLVYGLDFQNWFLSQYVVYVCLNILAHCKDTYLSTKPPSHLSRVSRKIDTVIIWRWCV